MSYQIDFESVVCRMPPGTPFSALAGPRVVGTSDGHLACSFVAQSGLGVNDFTPMLARSSDGGRTWGEAFAIWPDLIGKYSIFGSISRGQGGRLLFFGSRTVIESEGEMFWSDALQGLKANELIWAESSDDGRTWSPLRTIPQPVAGSAEAPGALCETRAGGLVCCYAPYRTFDPELAVETNQIVSLASDDGGRTWRAGRMLSFPNAKANGAEAWVVELSDGRILGTAWHINPGVDEPNAFALSVDGGFSWGPTQSTGILGQSTSLAPWRDGEALFIYNQRRHGDIGVWLARVRPEGANFGVVSNARVWAAPRPAQDPTKTTHESWTNFSFGEPAAVVLPDDSVFVVLWTAPVGGGGEIRGVRLRLNPSPAATG